MWTPADTGERVFALTVALILLVASVVVHLWWGIPAMALLAGRMVVELRRERNADRAQQRALADRLADARTPAGHQLPENGRPARSARWGYVGLLRSGHGSGWVEHVRSTAVGL